MQADENRDEVGEPEDPEVKVDEKDEGEDKQFEGVLPLREAMRGAPAALCAWVGEEEEPAEDGADRGEGA